MAKEKKNFDFNNYFKKIKETRNQQQNEEKRKEKLIKEISENSQFLTKEGLNDIAHNKHIKLVGNEFKIDDLNQQIKDLKYEIELLNTNESNKLDIGSPKKFKIYNYLKKKNLKLENKTRLDKFK